MTDDNERTWWLFELPGSFAYVPGDTEGHARRALAQNCYPNAPVASWRCLGYRKGARTAIAAVLLAASVSCGDQAPAIRDRAIAETVTHHSPCDAAQAWPELAAPTPCPTRTP